MPRQGAVHPVKAACLACRASKTRCDGTQPCNPCSDRTRDCIYRPSRRGGPRRSIKNEKKVQRMSVSRSSIPSPQTSGADSETQIPITNLVSETRDADSNSEIDPSLRHIVGLLTPFSSEPSLDVDPGLLWSPQEASDRNEITGPFLRVYDSEKDIINAYYHYIHPYISLLPSAESPWYEDRPQVFQPPPAEAGTIDKSSLPYWPTTSFTLALSALLALIPPPQDSNPSAMCHVWLRRSYAHVYAEAALSKAESEIDDLQATNIADRGSIAENRYINCGVPIELRPILALIVLSLYEYCQRGNPSRMRTRANQAITTAMDISLHCLDSTASEVHRRAWWSAIYILHFNSIVQTSRPIVTLKDPRITTPYPVFESSTDETDQPWVSLLRTTDAFLEVLRIVEEFNLRDIALLEPSHRQEQIRSVDSKLSLLGAKSASYAGLARRNDPDKVAFQSMGMIAHLLAHSARIRLHRYRAFTDIPLFVEKHCDLTAVNERAAHTGPSSTFEALFPFTEQESSIICLKSSLAIARVFRYLPSPRQRQHANSPGGYDSLSIMEGSPLVADNAAFLRNCPSTLPYFKCAAMQASYCLFMLLHRIRAALVSNRVSICHYLLAQPDPATEVQDVNRLMEELRHAIEYLKRSMEMDKVFEGFAAMGRGLNAVYLAVFPS
ncbi:hypothetical protein BDV25DRAFT_125848 [Aspergillus avenaceus]|uniref:Zn(2)-C6 fungal-type domain-containing protein n=1 Tax=Aspergillus avenaceus TaxID=36643 RepID=A0A5N6TT06_ASPAV|nr:hypothetical protein BDV25DRAFT_125848 [Aspergillus avenaceus]